MNTQANVKHSSASVEWYTPIAVIEAARACMGGIDLDPFSCPVAQEAVRATYYFTGEGVSGFEAPWQGRVFCNPPGGKEKGHRSGNAARAWTKAMHEWHAYKPVRPSQIIFIGFSLELLQTAQQTDAATTPLDFNLCIPSKRLAYRGLDGSKKSPPHASVIIGVGMSPEQFRAHFSAFGACR